MEPNQWNTSVLRIPLAWRCKPCPRNYRQKQNKMESSFENILQNYPHQNEKSGLKTKAQRLSILNSYAGTCSKSCIWTQTPWLLSMFKSRIFPSHAPNRKNNLGRIEIKITFLSHWWDKIQGRKVFYLPPAHFIPNWWALRDRHYPLGLRVRGLGKPQMRTDPKIIYFKIWYHLFIFPAFEKVTFGL